MHIRPAVHADLPQILEIHNDAIRTLKATWTNKLGNLAEMESWLDRHGKDGRLVLITEDAETGRVLGYAHLGRYRPKEGYRFTAGHSIYLHHEARGQGIGTGLLEALIGQARTGGYHVMVGHLDGENVASVRLHKRLGFEVSGRLPQVGTKFGEWLDLIIMTLVLNKDAPPKA